MVSLGDTNQMLEKLYKAMQLLKDNVWPEDNT